MTDVLETTTEGAVRTPRHRPEVRNDADLRLLGAPVDALEEGLAFERERFEPWTVGPGEVARRRAAVPARGRARTAEGA